MEGAQKSVWKDQSEKRSAYGLISANYAFETPYFGKCFNKTGNIKAESAEDPMVDSKVSATLALDY